MLSPKTFQLQPSRYTLLDKAYESGKAAPDLKVYVM